MSVDADALTLDAADWGRGGTVRLGTVKEFDRARCRVRVRLAGEDADAVTTGWLPWATWSAGHLRVWSPPAIGEQCLVLSPSGDLAQAVALPAVHQQDGPYPAPSDNPQHTLLAWDDGGYIRYERDTHRLILHASCVVRIEGDLMVTGDVYAGGVSLRRHRHTGVRKGASTSGGPTGGEAPSCQ
ncbi:phage baseplate assembly protein V [Pseudothauera hydrothermalis]|uniref:phage baseplate assembly protein V n=1 Tax=Pseudothauera hydrothermalis TaxID=2184083 RepID=UPI000E09ADF2|nr:phage baseplate assembly protein V [Pseudothauera hydrothermalis]